MKLADELAADHQLIERVVGAMRSYVTSVLEGAAPRSDAERFWRFFREFVGHVHHEREESVLFRALSDRLGLPEDRGPIPALVAQHRSLARCLDELDAMLAVSDVHGGRRAEIEAITALALRYSHGLLQHIDAENTVLLPESVARLARAGVFELDLPDVAPDDLVVREDGERLAQKYLSSHDPSALRGEGCVVCPSYGTTCDGIERTWWNEFEWDEFADRLG